MKLGVVTAQIEPVRAEKLLPFKVHLRSITDSHNPGAASPDFDHPITKAMVQQLPLLNYAGLEAVRAKLVQHDRSWISNARDVDTWLHLVNAEMQKRDRQRETDADSLIALLTKGSR